MTRFNIYSYNSDSTINDGSNFSAYFEEGTVTSQADGSPILVDRTHFAPTYANKTRAPRYLPIQIKCLGTLHSQYDTLRRLFSTTDDVLRTFIVKDSANSDKQWQLSVTPVSMSVDGQLVTINLMAPDSIWRSVSQNSDSWSITATGQTHNIATTGTFPVEPVFDIQPTSAKTGGQAYKRTVIIYNPTTRAMPYYPLEITAGGLNTAAIVSDTSKSNQINNGAGIGVGDATIDIDTPVGGGLPTVGMGYVGTEQISWTGNSGTQLTGCSRGINGTTAATHADNAVITWSRMQADGDDVTVYVDGNVANRWFGASGTHLMNASATYIWIVTSLSPKIEGTISAITDSATTLTFANTTANVQAIGKLPTSGMGYFGTELITWTGKNVTARTLTGLTRGVRGTTAAAHSAGVTFRWIEHVIELGYGDADATAPTVDDTYKPIFSLDSTATAWTYTSNNFSTITGKRAGEWKRNAKVSLAGGSVIPPKSEYFGTADHPTIPDNSDPYAVMGIAVMAFQIGTTWKPDSAIMSWQIYHPGGITDLTWNGKKYRASTSWPTKIFMQKGTTGSTWASINTTIATPGSASSWTAFTGSPTSLSGTYQYIRFIVTGAVTAVANNEASIYIDTCVLTLASANVPQIALGAEQTSTYALDAQLTNNTSGEYIKIKYLLKVNQTLRVDCLNHAVTLLDDNLNAYTALSLSSVRQDWLNLAPNVTVTLQWDETGSGNISLTTRYYDRTH